MPAGLLEVFLELRSPIDLDCPDWEGELLFHIFQEDRRREARGSPKRPAAVPTGDGVPGAVLVPDLAVAEPKLDGIDLDEISGSINPRRVLRTASDPLARPIFPRLAFRAPREVVIVTG